MWRESYFSECDTAVPCSSSLDTAVINLSHKPKQKGASHFDVLAPVVDDVLPLIAEGGDEPAQLRFIWVWDLSGGNTPSLRRHKKKANIS